MNTCLVSSITLFKNCEMYFYDIVGYPQQQPPNVPQASYPPPGSYPPQQQPTVPANVENFAPPPDYSVGKFSVQTVLFWKMDFIFSNIKKTSSLCLVSTPFCCLREGFKTGFSLSALKRLGWKLDAFSVNVDTKNVIIMHAKQNLSAYHKSIFHLGILHLGIFAMSFM